MTKDLEKYRDKVRFGSFSDFLRNIAYGEWIAIMQSKDGNEYVFPVSGSYANIGCKAPLQHSPGNYYSVGTYEVVEIDPSERAVYFELVK